MRNRVMMLVAAALVTLGCASAPAEGDAQTPPTRPEQTAALVPAGLGTLKQDEVTISLREGALLIKVTPLDEGVIRLLAPDTYDRLHALAESRKGEATREAGRDAPALFLVSFFSYQPDVEFTPGDLQIIYQGRTLRAAAVLAVTGGFGRQRLAQQENQTAIYAFDQTFDYNQAFTVRYGTGQSDEWTRIVQKLEVERGKVRARTTR